MALLQILEPGQNEENQHNEEVVIGIDLGTTNSLVAIVEEEKVKFFADENGCEIHPSIVNYDENGNVINIGQIQKQVQDDFVERHFEIGFESISTSISSIKFA